MATRVPLFCVGFNIDEIPQVSMFDKKKNNENDGILSALERIEEKYSLTICSEGAPILLDIDGLTEKFHLSISKDEHILFTDFWHIHLDDIPPFSPETFLEELFSGKIQIVVKFRGDTPIAQRINVIQEGKPKCICWVSGLFSPFWRPKSYKTFTYEAVKKAVDDKER